MVTPKFKIGDKVYAASSYHKEVQLQCPDCLGKKVWAVATPAGENFTIPCGTCTRGYFSYGTIGEWVESPHIELYTIGSVRIDTEDEHPVSYMCHETGIGSGTIHYEEALFSDRIDALAYATEKASKIVREEKKRMEGIIALGKKRHARNPVRP